VPVLHAPRTMLLVTAHQSASGARSFPRWFTKKARPGSSGVEMTLYQPRCKEADKPP